MYMRYWFSTGIFLLQLGNVLSSGNELIVVSSYGLPGIILLQLGVVLPAGNQLISQLFIYGLSFHYPAPTWLLAIS